MARQIMFYDMKEKSKHGGIQLDNGDVICGCCGGMFKAEEENTSWKMLKSFEQFWVNLDEEICGDEFFEKCM